MVEGHCEAPVWDPGLKLRSQVLKTIISPGQFRAGKKKTLPGPPPLLATVFYFFLFFISLPCPALALPCPVSNFPFAARHRRRKLYKERAMFFFLLLPGTGGGSYTGNGQCFFSTFATRDKRRKLHRELFFLLLPGTGGGSYTLHCPPDSAIESVTGLCRTDNPVTDRHHIVAFIYKMGTVC